MTDQGIVRGVSGYIIEDDYRAYLVKFSIEWCQTIPVKQKRETKTE